MTRSRHFSFVFVPILFLTIFAASATAATFAGSNTGAIADGTGSNVCGAARDVTFAVTGMPTHSAVSTLNFTITHTYIGDLQVILIAPNASQFVIFSFVGRQAAVNDYGDDSDLSGTYTFQDSATGNIWSAANLDGGGSVPAASYRTQAAGPFGNDDPGPPFTSLSPAFTAIPSPNGTWTLRFLDCAASDTGTVSAANLTLLVPTAANVNVSGRVVTADGRGLPFARLVLRDAHGNEKQVTHANPFGYFNIPNVRAGESYLLEVSSKNHTFATSSQLISVNDELTGLEFVAEQ